MAENGWQVQVEAARCIGSGICAGTAPAHFTLVDGLARPLAERVEPDEPVRDAAESCPVEAITVRDLGTGEQVAPEL